MEGGFGSGLGGSMWTKEQIEATTRKVEATPAATLASHLACLDNAVNSVLIATGAASINRINGYESIKVGTNQSIGLLSGRLLMPMEEMQPTPILPEFSERVELARMALGNPQEARSFPVSPEFLDKLASVKAENEEGVRQARSAVRVWGDSVLQQAREGADRLAQGDNEFYRSYVADQEKQAAMEARQSARLNDNALVPNRVAQLEAVLAATREQVKSLEEDKAGLDSENAMLRGGVNSSMRLRSMADERIAHMATTIDRLTADNATLSARVQALDGEGDGRAASLEAEMVSLKQVLAATTSRADHYEGEAKRLADGPTPSPWDDPERVARTWVENERGLLRGGVDEWSIARLTQVVKAARWYGRMHRDPEPTAAPLPANALRTVSDDGLRVPGKGGFW